MKYQKLLGKQNKHKQQGDQITMTQFDVILINDCGCELCRETTTPQKNIDSIINRWVILPWFKIIIQECQTEQ